MEKCLRAAGVLARTRHGQGGDWAPGLPGMAGCGDMSSRFLELSIERRERRDAVVMVVLVVIRLHDVYTRRGSQQLFYPHRYSHMNRPRQRRNKKEEGRKMRINI